MLLLTNAFSMVCTMSHAARAMIKPITTDLNIWCARIICLGLPPAVKYITPAHAKSAIDIGIVTPSKKLLMFPNSFTKSQSPHSVAPKISRNPDTAPHGTSPEGLWASCWANPTAGSKKKTISTPAPTLDLKRSDIIRAPIIPSDFTRTLSHKKSRHKPRLFVLVRRGGFSFASRLVVTRLGLGTASLPYLLAWGPLRRSNPTRKVSHTLLRREPENRKNWQKPVVSFFCAPGRIRTSGARRRLVYSQLQLTTLPPTQRRTVIRYTFFAQLSTKRLVSWIYCAM